MAKGFYCWGWRDTNEIAFDSQVEFPSEEMAKARGCFKRFKECKEYGLERMEKNIASLLLERDTLRGLKANMVEKV